MIRVNCVRFNMTAADAQTPELGIGSFYISLTHFMFEYRSHIWTPTGLGVDMSFSGLAYK